MMALTSKEGRVYFPKVAEDNKPNALMSETGFWKWLEKTEESHRIKAKRDYLESIGFDFNKNYIEMKEIETLRHIMDHFWFKKLGSIHKGPKFCDVLPRMIKNI